MTDYEYHLTPREFRLLQEELATLRGRRSITLDVQQNVQRRRRRGLNSYYGPSGDRITYTLNAQDSGSNPIAGISGDRRNTASRGFRTYHLNIDDTQSPQAREAVAALEALGINPYRTRAPRVETPVQPTTTDRVELASAGPTPIPARTSPLRPNPFLTPAPSSAPDIAYFTSHGFNQRDTRSYRLNRNQYRRLQRSLERLNRSLPEDQHLRMDNIGPYASLYRVSDGAVVGEVVDYGTRGITLRLDNTQAPNSFGTAVELMDRLRFRNREPQVPELPDLTEGQVRVGMDGYEYTQFRYALHEYGYELDQEQSYQGGAVRGFRISRNGVEVGNGFFYEDSTGNNRRDLAIITFNNMSREDITPMLDRAGVDNPRIREIPSNDISRELDSTQFASFSGSLPNGYSLQLIEGDRESKTYALMRDDTRVGTVECSLNAFNQRGVAGATITYNHENQDLNSFVTRVAGVEQETGGRDLARAGRR